MSLYKNGLRYIFFIVSIGFFLSPSYAFADTLDQHTTGTANTTNCYTELTGSPYNYVNCAQSYQPSSTNAVGSVVLDLFTTGSPVGNMSITIEADSSGHPSGTPLQTSTNISASTLTSTPTNTTFIFSDTYSYSTSSTYWIVLHDTDTVNGTNFIYVYGFANDTYYSSGTCKQYESDSTWHALNQDCYFQEYWYIQPTPIPTPTPTDTPTPTPTPVGPTPTPFPFIGNPNYVDVATNSALAKGIYDIAFVNWVEAFVICLTCGFFIGVWFYRR